MKKKSIFTIYDYVLTAVAVVATTVFIARGSLSFWGVVATVVTMLGSAVGLPLFFIYYIGRQTRLLREGEAAVATITGYVREGSIDEIYYSCFEFTAQGKIYNIQSKQSYGEQQYKTGEQVRIHYNPDDPQQAEIDDALREPECWVVILRVILFIMVAGICFPAIMDSYFKYFY